MAGIVGIVRRLTWERRKTVDEALATAPGDRGRSGRRSYR